MNKLLILVRFILKRGLDIVRGVHIHPLVDLSNLLQAQSMAALTITLVDVEIVLALFVLGEALHSLLAEASKP